AAEALADACKQVEVWPVRANAGFLARCAEHPRFVSGDVDTGFIALEIDALAQAPVPELIKLAGLFSAAFNEMMNDGGWEQSDVWSSLVGAHGLRLNAP